MGTPQPPVMSCEVCGGQALMPALDLGSHPLCDDLVAFGDTRVCREYPIEVLYCEACRTAHQRFQIPKRELFPSDYHYRARHTADVLSGMRQFATACETFLGSLGDTSVLDVGCNDGSLLSIFREKGAKTFGIEPTGAANDARTNGHKVLKEFLDEQVAKYFVTEFGQPDVITLTNVFAHIEDLPAVLRSFQLLGHKKTIIAIENHYLGSILDKRQFDTFYHEHPRTYSYRSFSVIAESLGMRIGNLEFPDRYGGNIRVILIPDPDRTREHVLWKEMDAKEERFGENFLDLERDIECWQANKKRQLQDAVRRYGPLRAKAFPGRSAIPIRMLHLDEGIISAVYEKPASSKVGHYVPGTRIPIKSDKEFGIGEKAGPLVNLAWHIAAEIQTYMRECGYCGPIIDIIANADFQR